jgi:hypothetical protein
LDSASLIRDTVGPRESAVPLTNSDVHPGEGYKAMPSTRQKRKVVMHEEGELKSSSGRKVKSRKQAIAIAMSESGQSKRRKKAS